MSAKLLRRRVVEDITGLSRSTIYRLMAANSFPRPVRLGQRSVAWRDSDIRTWMESREVA